MCYKISKRFHELCGYNVYVKYSFNIKSDRTTNWNHLSKIYYIIIG